MRTQLNAGRAKPPICVKFLVFCAAAGAAKLGEVFSFKRHAVVAPPPAQPDASGTARQRTREDAFSCASHRLMSIGLPSLWCASIGAPAQPRL